MGRLDDAAKHKVVELREAGLSFRKIKAVLELENIKVSTQSIYLFLREFQGRPTGRAQPVKSRSNTSTTLVQSRAGTIQENRSNVHQNLLREFQKQTSLNPETGAKPPRYGETSRGSTSDHQHEADKEDNDIRIVSVTSLAQNRPQSIVTGAQSDIVTSTLTAPGSLARRRVTPSPATSSTLAARKRILDKALTQRMKQSFHQVASLLKKDHLSVQGSNLRSALPQATETYDLTTEKTVLESQSGGREGGGVPKRSQKMGLSPRSPHPLPRVGIRLPSRPPAALPSSAPGPPIIRLKGAGGQVASCSERNPSPQQAAQDHGERGGLQAQIQTLGSEVRSLGVAVEKLVEHQCRMEREQAQQTHIQKQILTILQSIAIKLRRSSSSQQHHNNTPSPSTLPKAPAATSFSQDNFSFSQGTYTHCSQSQPSYNSVESLENVETFKLPALNPAGMNGFHENLPLPHTPPQTQPYAAPVYTDQTSQTLIPPYTQSYISTYNQSQMQSFRISGSKSFDLPSTCAAGTLQDCTMSTQTAENSTLMPQDPHLSVIKVEGP